MESHSKTSELSRQLKIICDLPGDFEVHRERLAVLYQKNLIRHQAAICICFAGEHFLDSKILLTMRSSELPTHASQVAFPGGSTEPQDKNDFIKTALRECAEEVGFVPPRASVVGQLPAFPTFTGNFEVVPVLAAVASSLANFSLSSEVVVAEWVSVRELIGSRRIEKYTISSVEVEAPFFMWGDKKMWGLSALIFDLILKRYDTIKE